MFTKSLHQIPSIYSIFFNQILKFKKTTGIINVKALETRWEKYVIIQIIKLKSFQLLPTPPKSVDLAFSGK